MRKAPYRNKIGKHPYAGGDKGTFSGAAVTYSKEIEAIKNSGAVFRSGVKWCGLHYGCGIAVPLLFVSVMVTVA